MTNKSSHRVLAISQFTLPKDKKQLREYLGLLNFYHRFVPKAANVLGPLHKLIQGKKNLIEWTDEAKKAFAKSKTALAESTMLIHPKGNAAASLTVDASDEAVGAVYEQYIGDSWKPIAFFSKKLSNAERKYSAFDRELLAIYLSFRHFRHLVEGRKFHIFTDHKPLTSAMGRTGESWTAQQT